MAADSPGLGKSPRAEQFRVNGRARTTFKLRAMPQNRLPGPGLLGPFGAANTLALDFSNLSSSMLVGGEHPDSCHPWSRRCPCVRAPGSGARQGCRLWGAGRKVVGRLEGVVCLTLSHH